MFRTKSRRNIRSKRNRSRKNRSRKNRNLSRRMKGGDLTVDEIIEINGHTVCTYDTLLTKYKYDKSINEDDFKDIANKLMLYRIKFSNDYPLSEYPNPMSIKAIVDTEKPAILFLYVNSDTECHATVM